MEEYIINTIVAIIVNLILMVGCCIIKKAGKFEYDSFWMGAGLFWILLAIKFMFVYMEVK